MTTFVLFASFFILMILSVPIGIALGLSGLLTALVSPNISMSFLVQGLITSTDNFALLAIPFFILAGELMGKGGISNRLFDLANVMVGRVTGGFAIAAVITCMFFAAISGSGPATVAAVGGIMIPAMVAQGYDKKFATAIIVTAGSLGIILPPSIPMVLYGISGNQSIGDLFLGGILPGILIGILLMIWSYIYSKKKGYHGSSEAFSFKKLLSALNAAKWSLLIPVIILGGIYGGIFTPTEAAVIAVVYAGIISLFAYKEISFRSLPRIMADASVSSVAILIIIGTANTFGKILTLEDIPSTIANAFLSVSTDPMLIVFLLIALLLFIGLFIDTSAAVIIFTPILLPVAIEVGLDPIHFGIIMIVTLAIGFITPPLGVNLFVGSSISGIGVPQLVKASIPFFFVMLFGLIIIALIPSITLLLL